MTCDFCGQEIIGDLSAHYSYDCNVKPDKPGLMVIPPERSLDQQQPEPSQFQKRQVICQFCSREAQELNGSMYWHYTKVCQGWPISCKYCGQWIAHEKFADHLLQDHPKWWYRPGLHVVDERSRVPLPRNVKREVWTRDGGRCRGCRITDAEAVLQDGEHLHYDHIVPFSKGGADTVDNIQLLCGTCNRSKGAR